MPGKKRPYPWTCGRLGSIEKDEDQNTYGFSSGICTDLKEKFLNKSYVQGNDEKLEMKLRVFCLTLYSQQNEGEDAKINWLINILKTYCEQPKQMARLIYLMFGPLTNDQTPHRINWDERFGIIKEDDFKFLGEVLGQLFSKNELIHEVMMYLIHNDYDENNCLWSWSEQNIAFLLLHMTPESQKWYLTNLSEIMPITPDLSAILAHLIMAAASAKHPLEPSFVLVENVISKLNDEYRKNIIGKLWYEITEHLQEIFLIPTQLERKNLILDAMKHMGVRMMKIIYIDRKHNSSQLSNTEE